MVSENVVGCESELSGPLRSQDNHGLAGLDPCAISAARRGSEHYEERPRGNAADRTSADVDQTRECPGCPGNPSVAAVMGAICLDGYAVPLTSDRIKLMSRSLEEAQRKGGLMSITVTESEEISWKQIMPALVERCRFCWEHRPGCEYGGPPPGSPGGRRSGRRSGTAGGRYAPSPIIVLGAQVKVL